MRVRRSRHGRLLLSPPFYVDILAALGACCTKFLKALWGKYCKISFPFCSILTWWYLFRKICLCLFSAMAWKCFFWSDHWIWIIEMFFLQEPSEAWCNRNPEFFSHNSHSYKLQIAYCNDGSLAGSTSANRWLSLFFRSVLLRQSRQSIWPWPCM